MNFSKLPPVIVEAICVYEALMILGFRAEDVWCVIHVSAMNDRKSLFIELTGKPGEFSIEVGPCELPDDEIQDHWTAGTEAWNASDKDDIQPIWDRSAVAQQVPMLAYAIRAKGIILPAMAN